MSSGDGLPGPMIDTGDNPVERRTILPTWLKAVASLALVMSLVAMLVAALLFATNSGSIEAIERESTERKDQECVLFERQHASNVDRLRTTYGFLSTVQSAGAKDDPLIQAVLRGLPPQEVAARGAVPPPYCSERGVGLAEPPPPVPPKQDFSHLKP